MKTILSTLLTLILCPALLAQTLEQPRQIQRIQIRTVDQAVGDLDGLSRSMRRQGSGLRVDGEHTSLYTISKDKLQQLQVLGQAAPISGVQRANAYLRIAPGLLAQSDQTNYLVASRTSATGLATNVAPALDGQFLEAIPANTVFILSPQLKDILYQANIQQALPQYAAQNKALQNKAMRSNRVDNRIDGRVKSNRVNNRYQDRHAPKMPQRTLRYEVHALRVPTRTPVK